MNKIILETSGILSYTFILLIIHFAKRVPQI